MYITSYKYEPAPWLQYVCLAKWLTGNLLPGCIVMA